MKPVRNLLFFNDGRFWLGFGLEWDVMSQGDSLEETFKNLIDTIKVNKWYREEDTRAGKKYTHCGPSPKRYYEMFQKGWQGRLDGYSVSVYIGAVVTADSD